MIFFYCLLTPRIQCSQNDKKDDYLMARTVSSTCQLKPSVEADIRDLKTKVDDILNLLKTPKIGNVSGSISNQCCQSR